MPRLRIEYVPIRKFALGWFGFDHLQLVLEPDAIPMVPNPQDDWYILEGDSETSDHGAFLGVLGESGTLTMSVANLAFGQELVDKIGTPATRGSRVLSPKTASVSAAWSVMASYGAEIQLNDFPYLAYGAPYTPFPTFNSSSVVASLLWQVGIDVNVVMPYGVGLSPGTSTLLGTEHNDVMVMPTVNFDTLAGGHGNDDLSGTNAFFRVDKLFGGAGDDTFHWSTGRNIINGGDPVLDRAHDGYDRVDYKGAGTITVNLGRGFIPSLTPDFVVTFNGNSQGSGTDWLYSIDSIRWDAISDTIIWGRGVTGIEENLNVDMGAQDSKPGDTADFSQSQNAVVMEATAGTDEVRIKFAAGDGSSKALWITGAESVIGSAHNDELHLDAGMTSADGRDGDDLIDGRNVKPNTGASPNGYDAELTGGGGSDTLIAGAGRTLAKGGEGTDKFVLATLSSANQPTEFVIADASADDRLYVPLNFFNGSIGSASNSLLMPVLGGVGDWNLFSKESNGYFIYQSAAQSIGDDATAGLFPFNGEISFFRDGDDLLISVVPGITATRIVEIEGTPPFEITYAELDATRQTIVRVLNFTPGLLGITFDQLVPDEGFLINQHGLAYTTYSNWDAVVNRVTAGGALTLTLPPNPVGSPAPKPKTGTAADVSITGTASNDTIDLTAPAAGRAEIQAEDVTSVSAGDGDDTVTSGASADTVHGGAGNDTLTTGAGEDVLDGGAGADTMTGGAGDDTYLVDDMNDTVVEGAAQGRDTVESAISYTLPDNVENLTLTGTAIGGTGNALRNTLIGNDADNTLEGGAGDDTLYGGNGDDTLSGGIGDDAYVYRAGTGHKTIIDTGSAGDADVLVLAAGIQPGDVRAYRLSSAPDTLVLGFTFGGWVALVGQLTGSGVEEIAFDDGTVWTRTDIAALDAPLLAFPPPEALDDSNIVIFGTQATVPSLAVLGNDLSFDGNLTIIAVNDVSAGTMTVDANGNLAVSAPAGYIGDVTFRYTILDSHGETSTASATIYVAEPPAPPPNSVPVLGADTFASVYRDTPITLAAAALLANDTDADGDVLTIVGAGNPAHGQIIQQPGGSLTFTPAAGYTGPASFTYTVSDGNGGMATATVSLNVVVPPPVTLRGTSLNDILTGGAGDDILDGLAGNDTLNGGFGSDVMTGGDGSDTYFVDNPGDRVVETNSVQAPGGLDWVHTTIDYTLPNFVEQLSLEGAAIRGTGNAGNNVLDGRFSQQVLTLDGGSGDDVLYGSSLGFNTMTGGDGKDTLNASGTNNLLTGGLGNDSYYSQSATDVIVEAAAAGLDTLYTSDSILALAANVEAVVLQGNAISATANALDNTMSATTTHSVILDAGAGNDSVTGTAYDDILAGGTGNDQIDLRAGGHDTVRYPAGGFGRDTILGFDPSAANGRDYIDLTGRGYTAASLGKTIQILSSGGDTYIAIGNDSLRLVGVTASDITAANFKF